MLKRYLAAISWPALNSPSSSRTSCKLNGCASGGAAGTTLRGGAPGVIVSDAARGGAASVETPMKIAARVFTTCVRLVPSGLWQAQKPSDLGQPRVSQGKSYRCAWSYRPRNRGLLHNALFCPLSCQISCNLKGPGRILILPPEHGCPQPQHVAGGAGLGTLGQGCVFGVAAAEDSRAPAAS